MYFSIQHQTRFRYDAPVSESIMELRMQPRSEGKQRCFSYFVKVNPKARVLQYRDHLGNYVHHFSVAPKHTQLLVTTESTVETYEPDPIPAVLPLRGWEELDHTTATQDFWEFVMPSELTEPTPLLNALSKELRVERREDPLTMCLELNRAIYASFEYVPKSTRVNSPIDHALGGRKGVCQDFAHIMTALLRELRIPARYVSGYLFHSRENKTRSVDGATHAWVEAFLPGIGWTGFDPTNNLLAGSRHIRTAIGRDYNDVPPTRGTYRGGAQSEMAVVVRVTKADAPIMEDLAKELLFNSNPPVFDERPLLSDDLALQQQQQQQ
ncbi:transglutaminase family protein [Bryobacter aggregatus]|uniref:transglutaminase family protein n=1 Tax=Bryobacter aggregatus TaxID=360054 RepID=UPI0004E0FF04|nr:transglutaminase family protein [Bryobacter aggregatus]